jgi:hypothetical protein
MPAPKPLGQARDGPMTPDQACKAPGLRWGRSSVREKVTYRLIVMLSCITVGRIGSSGTVGTLHTSKSHALLLSAIRV